VQAGDQGKGENGTQLVKDILLDNVIRGSPMISCLRFQTVRWGSIVFLEDPVHLVSHIPTQGGAGVARKKIPAKKVTRKLKARLTLNNAHATTAIDKVEPLIRFPTDHLALLATGRGRRDLVRLAAKTRRVPAASRRRKRQNRKWIGRRGNKRQVSGRPKWIRLQQ